MAGFLSDYNKTRRVPIGRPERGYWAEIREVLSVGDKEEADRALARAHVGDGGVQMEMDTVGYRQLMVLRSIIAWNLDNEDGTIWPITLESIKRLPDLEFNSLHAVIDKLNAPPSKSEQAQFPEGDGGGDSDGNRATVIAGQVLARTGTVEEAGTPAGGPPQSTMA